jgi:uncharacterized membrane protein YfcA
MPWFHLSQDLHYLVIFVVGVAAGTINTIVGSGSLITFPTLVALGYPPVTANISNNIGLVPGGLSGSWGYRHELVGQSHAVWRLLPCSAAGGVIGALLLLVLPASAFDKIVPVLIGIAVVLVALQPQIMRLVQRRRAEPHHGGRDYGLIAMVAAFICGMYGGYFGAAQGVLLIGLLGVLVDDALQKQNALKNVLTTSVNLIAAITFVLTAFNRINWLVALLIGAGSLVGGFIGARIGRRLPTVVLRGVIVVIGIIAMIGLLLK